MFVKFFSFCYVLANKREKQYRNDALLKMIGKRIRDFRVAKGLSQMDLALRCGDVDWSQISRMERGIVNFSISYLHLVAQELNVKPKDLLDFEE